MRGTLVGLTACIAGCIYVDNEDFDDPAGTAGNRELCDNRDNDGDGVIDEFSSLNGTCDQCTMAERGEFSYFFCYNADPMTEPLQLSWDAARMHCESFGNGVALASVVDTGENGFIASNIAYPAWLGGEVPETYPPGEWIDGTLWTYDGFPPTGPTSDTESSHVRMEGQGGGWVDAIPSELAGFVCKFEQPT